MAHPGARDRAWGRTGRRVLEAPHWGWCDVQERPGGDPRGARARGRGRPLAGRAATRPGGRSSDDGRVAARPPAGPYGLTWRSGSTLVEADGVQKPGSGTRSGHRLLEEVVRAVRPVPRLSFSAGAARVRHDLHEVGVAGYDHHRLGRFLRQDEAVDVQPHPHVDALLSVEDVPLEHLHIESLDQITFQTESFDGSSDPYSFGTAASSRPLRLAFLSGMAWIAPLLLVPEVDLAVRSVRNIIALLAIAGSLVLTVGSVGEAESPIIRIAQENLRTVVTVIALDKDQQPLALGSGFFVDANGSVASNAHVIEKAATVVVRWRGKNVAASEVTRFDRRYDLAVLTTPLTGTPSVKFGDSDSVKIGEDVVALGNPQGLEGTVSNGILSGVREVGGVRYLQITAPISPGSSGGPIFNVTSHVIGIASATLASGQNLNFAVPVNLLKELPRVSASFATIEARRIESSDTHQLKDLVRVINILEDSNCGKFTGFRFSIQNDTRDTIDSVKLLVIILDHYRSNLDFLMKEYQSLGIPPGLARQLRLSHEVFGYGGTLQLEKSQVRCGGDTGSFEMRVLDFAFKGR